MKPIGVAVVVEGVDASDCEEAEGGCSAIAEGGGFVLRSGSEGHGLGSFPWCFGGHCNVIADRPVQWRCCRCRNVVRSCSSSISSSSLPLSRTLKRRIAREKGGGQRKRLEAIQSRSNTQGSETFKYVGTYVGKRKRFKKYECECIHT